MKHAKLRNIDYWWLDFVQNNRCPNLALIMFNDIAKATGRGMNTNITLSHDTYLSYIFRQLGISTLGDSPITSNQPISHRALHHADYHDDANFSEWIKEGSLVADDNDDEGAFKHVPSPEHAPPLASSSYVVQPFSEVTITLFDAIYSLNNDARGLREDVNSRLSTLEAQMMSLLAHFPLALLDWI
ncbi:hypothetical protein PVK06_008383 [Gossypium arboreum]|uniref:Uncharacterized protein n=1 Tax=Gossypium arboreum TaxID=29729 RepID=A0ABR0QJT4_GOSAR|nr:hypothetical protein PVK06_008383 [Gossypium arboreum]